MHALEYFPEGPDQFYNDLVWAFHTINGGENLPWDGKYEYTPTTPIIILEANYHFMQLKVFFGSCLDLDFNSVFRQVLLGTQVCICTN